MGAGGSLRRTMNTLAVLSTTCSTQSFYTRSTFKSDREYKGKYSVPILWDKKKNQIVNNESEDIIRMLNTAFDDYLPKEDPRRELNFYPPALKEKMDEINRWIMPSLNTGVYPFYYC